MNENTKVGWIAFGATLAGVLLGGFITLAVANREISASQEAELQAQRQIAYGRYLAAVDEVRSLVERSLLDTGALQDLRARQASGELQPFTPDQLLGPLNELRHARQAVEIFGSEPLIEIADGLEVQLNAALSAVWSVELDVAKTSEGLEALQEAAAALEMISVETLAEPLEADEVQATLPPSTTTSSKQDEEPLAEPLPEVVDELEVRRARRVDDLATAFEDEIGYENVDSVACATAADAGASSSELVACVALQNIADLQAQLVSQMRADFGVNLTDG